MPTNEAASRVRVDALLKDVGWNLTDGRSVRFETPCLDGSRAGNVWSNRLALALVVLETNWLRRPKVTE
jgi:type I restriction enzyme R subunit